MSTSATSVEGELRQGEDDPQERVTVSGHDNNLLHSHTLLPVTEYQCSNCGIVAPCVHPRPQLTSHSLLPLPLSRSRAPVPMPQPQFLPLYSSAEDREWLENECRRLSFRIRNYTGLNPNWVEIVMDQLIEGIEVLGSWNTTRYYAMTIDIFIADATTAFHQAPAQSLRMLTKITSTEHRCKQRSYRFGPFRWQSSQWSNEQR